MTATAAVVFVALVGVVAATPTDVTHVVAAIRIVFVAGTVSVAVAVAVIVVVVVATPPVDMTKATHVTAVPDMADVAVQDVGPQMESCHICCAPTLRWHYHGLHI